MPAILCVCRMRSRLTPVIRIGGMLSVNAAVLLLVPAPAVAWDHFCRRSASSTHATYPTNVFPLFVVPSCQGWQKHPVASVNSLLLWNMCALFWSLSLLQHSTWVSVMVVPKHSAHDHYTYQAHSRSYSLQLIDPYWTLIPSLIEAYYATHPAATGSSRSKCAAAMVGLWSVRLSHSYLRR